MANPADTGSADKVAQAMPLQGVPHARALGMALVSIEKGVAVLSVPYDERFVGNPQTGVIHGGVVTALLDNASGIAVASALGQFRPMATLDLRIDYMRPATPQKMLLARAHCYKLTSSIAFVRGAAYHEDPDDPIATSSAAFMLDANRSRPHSALKDNS